MTPQQIATATGATLATATAWADAINVLTLEDKTILAEHSAKNRPE